MLKGLASQGVPNISVPHELGKIRLGGRARPNLAQPCKHIVYESLDWRRLVRLAYQAHARCRLIAKMSIPIPRLFPKSFS